MSGGFSLLWSKILYSSLWIKESKETRLVWIALMALRDSKGVIQASMVGLADAAKVSPDECRKAIKTLTSPDKDDTSGIEEGRRLREIPGGWEIVNHDLYRFSTEAKREFWRTDKAERRAVKAEKKKHKHLKLKSHPDTHTAMKVRQYEEGVIDHNGEPIH